MRQQYLTYHFIYMILQKINSMKQIFPLLCTIVVSTSHQQIVLNRRQRTADFQQNQNCVNPTLNTNQTLGAGNCADYLYFITVGIGTPPQYFQLQFDTGSPTLWVPTTQVYPNGFNASASSTYQNSTRYSSIDYAGNNNVSGFIGTDFVSFSPIIHVQLDSILFATLEFNMNFPGNVVGIIGMDFTPKPNFLDLAYQAGQIKTNTFALNLLNTSNQSLIYYNQIPQDIQNSTLYSPVVTNLNYWQLSLVGFYANQNDLTSYAVNLAIIDSGTSLFNLNPSLFNQIQSMYLQECRYSSRQGNFLCPNCSNISMPTLYFMFPGVQVEIDNSSYITLIGNGSCYVYINTLSTETNIVLGDTLFLNYIITFDKENATVGFSGKIEQVPVIGKKKSGFETSQFVMISFCLIILLVFCFLVYYLRILGVQDSNSKDQKQMQTAQIRKSANPKQV